MGDGVVLPDDIDAESRATAVAKGMGRGRKVEGEPRTATIAIGVRNGRKVKGKTRAAAVAEGVRSGWKVENEPRAAASPINDCANVPAMSEFYSRRHILFSIYRMNSSRRWIADVAVYE